MARKQPMNADGERNAGVTAIQSATSKPRRFDLTGPVLPVLVLVACGFYAATFPPVADHAYQFYQAERVLDGARMYVDVGAADMHPPLFTWLAVALAAVGRLLHVSGLSLFPGVVLLTTAVTLWMWWRSTPHSGWMLGVLVLALVPGAGPYYGQGEHLAILLSLPYLANASAAAAGSPVRRRTAFISALFAGIGLAMKPYFALVWLGVETYVATRRGLRSLLRTESVTIGAIFVLYAASALVVTPEFFANLPWLEKLYPGFAPVPVSRLLFDLRTLLMIGGLVACLTVRGSRAGGDQRWLHLARVLAIPLLAMYATVLLQGKGWGYHWYPVSALSLVLLGLAVRPLLERGRGLRLAIPGLALVAVVWMQQQTDRTTRLLVSHPTDLPQMLDLVERYAEGQPIVALSYLLQVGFPLVNLTNATWASPYGHLWMVPALYPAGWAGSHDFRYSKTRFPNLEQQFFDRIWQTIDRDNPAIILLDRPLRSGFDMRKYFETDARFRDRFARSPVLDTIGAYIALGRPSPDRATVLASPTAAR